MKTQLEATLKQMTKPELTRLLHNVVTEPQQHVMLGATKRKRGGFFNRFINSATDAVQGVADSVQDAADAATDAVQNGTEQVQDAQDLAAEAMSDFLHDPTATFHREPFGGNTIPFNVPGVNEPLDGSASEVINLAASLQSDMDSAIQLRSIADTISSPQMPNLATIADISTEESRLTNGQTFDMVLAAYDDAADRVNYVPIWLDPPGKRARGNIASLFANAITRAQAVRGSVVENVRGLRDQTAGEFKRHLNDTAQTWDNSMQPLSNRVQESPMAHRQSHAIST